MPLSGSTYGVKNRQREALKPGTEVTGRSECHAANKPLYCW